MLMYSLTSEDLTGLVSMEHQNVKTNWRKYFSTSAAAKRYAEKDYGKPIKWRGYSSGDLMHVMYTVEKVDVHVDKKGKK